MHLLDADAAFIVDSVSKAGSHAVDMIRFCSGLKAHPTYVFHGCSVAVAVTIYAMIRREPRISKNALLALVVFGFSKAIAIAVDGQCKISVSPMTHPTVIIKGGRAKTVSIAVHGLVASVPHTAMVNILRRVRDLVVTNAIVTVRATKSLDTRVIRVKKIRHIT
jgi:hypothetical protein